MKKRSYGILMPISSLPSGEGIGVLGEGAYKFVDFLTEIKAKVWQVLPMNPTNYGDSPYQSCSSDALNYYFIDLESLKERGLLTKKEISSADLSDTPRRVNYSKQFNAKVDLLKIAFSRFKQDDEFAEFVKEGKYADFATFMALKSKHGFAPWNEWDDKYRNYDEKVIKKFNAENADQILFWQFTQFELLKEWKKLKSYANEREIKIMGDIPLYIAYDSVEVWKLGDELFKMDARRTPLGVAGCPPDAFTEDGQLWGNPVYDWQKMKKGGYEWWNKRLKGCFELFDILRIDHFRGFDRYYEIPPTESTARFGVWVDGPKEDLFADKLGLDIVAEDLGLIDDGVKRLMKNVGYPGMKILEFAFDGSPDNEHKPSNHGENFVCYTGTHDNMPIKQYIADLPKLDLYAYKSDLYRECQKAGFEADTASPETMCKDVVKLAFASPCYLSIIPYWDIKAMGGEARINLPSTVSVNNWSWRFVPEDFTPADKEFLKSLAEKFNRA